MKIAPISIFLLAFFIIFEQSTGSILKPKKKRNTSGRNRYCGIDLVSAMDDYICQDSGFELPYSHLYVPHISNLNLRVPYNDIKPFRDMAIRCCRIGCKYIEYIWMCEYQREVINKCRNKHNGSRNKACEIQKTRNSRKFGIVPHYP